MRKNTNYYLRKSHRYLGLFIGIQFLLWTVGGLYFSWNNIDEIHGDHLRNKAPLITLIDSIASPQKALETLKKNNKIDAIISLDLVEILGKPHYRISYLNNKNGKIAKQYQLVSATDGTIRPQLTKEEAIEISNNFFTPNAEIKEVKYITEVDAYSEYREKPLPAWAISYEHEDSPTIYIGATTGTFQAIRHSRWRIFDFLWMLHTMDYETKDNFGNILLKSFSILGLITVMSGFVLFYISSPTVRKIKKKFGD